jgi:hypothetical protein
VTNVNGDKKPIPESVLSGAVYGPLSTEACWVVSITAGASKPVSCGVYGVCKVAVPGETCGAGRPGDTSRREPEKMSDT